MADSPDLRVSDAEREAAAGVLRDAAAAGRLDHDELEERVQRAYAARTRSELDAVTADLPVPAPASAPVPAPTSHAPALRGEQARRRLAGFLIPNVVCNAVWLATGAGEWWPVWVLLGTGIGFVIWLINAALGVDGAHAGSRSRERRHERRAGRRLPPPPPSPPS